MLIYGMKSLLPRLVKIKYGQHAHELSIYLLLLKHSEKTNINACTISDILHWCRFCQFYNFFILFSLTKRLFFLSYYSSYALHLFSFVTLVILSKFHLLIIIRLIYIVIRCTHKLLILPVCFFPGQVGGISAKTTFETSSSNYRLQSSTHRFWWCLW